MITEYLQINKEKCIGCGACMQVCPAPDANIVKKTVEGESIVELNADRCLGCGRCITACKQEVRSYTDDLDTMMSDMKKGKRIILVVSPEIKFSFNKSSIISLK